MKKLTITYDPTTNIYTIRFGNKFYRRYGSLATLLGALADYFTKK